MVQLKGNYDLEPEKQDVKKASDSGKSTASKAPIEEEFEKRSLEKLGGSIAFVVKSKSLVWDGKDE